MISSFHKNACCANDDTIPNNPKSTFFADGENENSESTLSRSLFLNEYTRVDNLDRPHSL